MRYGYFDTENKEYVIERPDTPVPWMNYLHNDEYCALISNNGGGYSFHLSARDKRILRYRLNNIPMDRSRMTCAACWAVAWLEIHCNSRLMMSRLFMADSPLTTEIPATDAGPCANFSTSLAQPH